jgi:hypothetical protein
MRDVGRCVGLVLGACLVAEAAAGQARDSGEVAAGVDALRREVAGLQLALRHQEERYEAMRGELRAVAEGVTELRNRAAPPVVLPFLSGSPPSTDNVGVSRVAVFAPRLVVDSARQHDIVFLRLKRVEPGAIRPVADLELGSDQLQLDLPLDQNGALYILDWQTSEGTSYNLLLRDGAGGAESLAAPAATVQVKPLQNQGRFIFVGYSVE